MEMILYHTTLVSNLESIMENGLIPQVGERSKKLKEDPAVFLFPTYEDCIDALGNWLGEEFDAIEPYQEVITLEINLPDNFPLEESVGYEKFSKQTIPPQFIKFYKNEG
jgi:hypothetical protein